MFFKKKYEPTVLIVPEPETLAVLDLWDKDTKQRSKTAHYFLWKRISEIFPITQKGTWGLKHGGHQIAVVSTEA